MLTDWNTSYQVAIREQDPAKLEDLCEQARHAIHNRVLELAESPADARERGELEEALRQLTIHKYKRTVEH
ncbi:MAG: hypothetical protein LAO30_02400 [Acidobacteriia bacterium]|nr:hypothetical protein [Terriglobia bacterium]